MIQALRHESSESLACDPCTRAQGGTHSTLQETEKKYANKIHLLSLNSETLFCTLNSDNSTFFFTPETTQEHRGWDGGDHSSPFPGMGCSIQSPGMAQRALRKRVSPVEFPELR